MRMDLANMLRSHFPFLRGNAFDQTNLVSDGSVPAQFTDPNLINPWGLASNGLGGPFWVADNGTGVSTAYAADGTPQMIGGSPTVTIATPAGKTGTAAPTGEVFNFAKHGFNISSGGATGPSHFLFATEDGTISGWNPNVDPSSSVLAVDNSATGAVYKGLAIGQTRRGRLLLYAANFHDGTVEMYDSSFNLIRSFTDPNAPAGYAPFNVQVIGGHLFVTFAQQNATKHDDVSGPGHGLVDEFTLGGQLIQQVASGGPLNSPWGLAMAPANFGRFSNDLLVGNFGDGTINAYDPQTDAFLGKVRGADGKPVQIGDLWALTSGGLQNPDALYFTAGVQGEAHGLVGTLTAGHHPHQPMSGMSTSQSYG